MTRRPLLALLIGALALPLAAPGAWASRAPKGAEAALQAWRAALQGGDAAALAALVPEGGVLFRVPGHPKLPAELRLHAAELQARLQGGEGRALGLHKDLLLPTARDLRKAAGGRYQASHPGCPEVTWIFAPAPGGRWHLAEVQRKFLEC